MREKERVEGERGGGGFFHSLETQLLQRGQLCQGRRQRRGAVGGEAVVAAGREGKAA